MPELRRDGSPAKANRHGRNARSSHPTRARPEAFAAESEPAAGALGALNDGLHPATGQGVLRFSNQLNVDRTKISATQNRHANAGDTLPCHTDLTGGCPREVNDATSDVGPAIIDENIDRATVVQMLDANSRPERQRLVGSRHGVGIELATGRKALRLPVVRCHPGLTRALQIAGAMRTGIASAITVGVLTDARSGGHRHCDKQ